MATDFSLPVFTVQEIVISGTAYRLPVFQTGKTVKVKLAGSPFTEYSGVEEGTTGIYKFTGVEDGKYHKLIDGVQSGTFGVTNGRYIADDDMAQYAKLAGNNTFTGNNTYSGTGTHNGTNNFNGSAVIKYPSFKPDSEWYTNAALNLPANGCVPHNYLLGLIAGLVTVPFQESTNYVRVIPNGVTETGKVYTSVKSATSFFASPSDTNQCMVEIRGTGIASKYIIASPGTLRDYVHIKGAGRHINLILSDGPALSKQVTLENMTIFLGANDFSGAREYSNLKIINCTVYSYRDTTWNSCELLFSRFIYASTYKSKLKGAVKCEMCGFNNEPDLSLISGGYNVGNYGIDITSLPVDPSTPVSEG